METKFNFNSQICTSREQSERLLALGLKKETADMTWKFSYLMKGVPQYDCLAESTWDEETIARYVQHCGLMNLTEHWKHSDGTQMSSEDVYAEITKKDIPAWSLHRLIEMMPFDILPEGGFDNCFTLIKNYPKGYSVEYDGFSYYYKENIYDTLIDAIEHLIKEGYFNKEYLEE